VVPEEVAGLYQLCGQGRRGRQSPRRPALRELLPSAGRRRGV